MESWKSELACFLRAALAVGVLTSSACGLSGVGADPAALAKWRSSHDGQGLPQCRTPTACDDANVCTIDSCDANGCHHSPASGYCSDGDACTNGDTCQSGSCVAGTPAQCQASTTCAKSYCDKTEGCTLEAQGEGGPCGAAGWFCQVGSCTEPWGVSVAVGSQHACALSVSGGVSCWGANDSGQFGNGSLASSAVPLTSSLSSANALAAGSAHVCARSGANVACWGLDADLQTGNGTGTVDQKPFAVTLPAAATAVVAGASHSCALTVKGEVYCWGSNQYGELGQATSGPAQATPQNVAGTFVGLAAGAHTSCAYDAAGALTCWGARAGTWGGLGSPAGPPTLVQGLGPVRQVAIADTHACAILKSGPLFCWGTNAFGELGNGSTVKDYVAPVQVLLGPQATAVSVGSVHSCALTLDGGVWCWGHHVYGQLGVGMSIAPDIVRSVPLKINDLQAVSLSAFENRTCVARLDGAVACWGKMPPAEYSLVPVVVPGTAP